MPTFGCHIQSLTGALVAYRSDDDDIMHSKPNTVRIANDLTYVNNE